MNGLMKKLNRALSNAMGMPFDEARFYGYFGLMVVITMFYIVFLGYL